MFGRKRKLHFLHLGKTGGSAVKWALEKAKDSNYKIVLHPHETLLKDIPKGEKVFFFVRDPIARFVSAFYSRWRKGQPRYQVPWTPAEARAFSRFSTPNRLALGLLSEDEGLRDEARQAMRSIGHLRDSYWHWFGDEEEVANRREDFFFIGFTETLSSDFSALIKKLGLSSDTTLPQDPVASHRMPEGWDTHLDPKAHEALRIWYGRDYEFLRLARNWASALNGETPSKPVTLELRGRGPAGSSFGELGA